MAKPKPTGTVSVIAHPANAEISAFFAGTLDSPTRLRVFRHLLTGCGDCADICLPVLAGHARAFAPVPSEEAYDAPIDRALAGLREKVRAWTELVAAPMEDPLKAQLAWVERMIRVARLLRGGALIEYTQFATEALDAALALAEREPGEALLWDLISRARSERANAKRLAGLTQEAILDLEMAREEAIRGSKDRALIIEIANLAASVYIAAREFDRAAALLAQLEEIHRAAGDTGSLGQTLMKSGNVDLYRGALPEAAFSYIQAFDALRATDENEMAAFAFKNAVDCYLRAGLYAEASQLLPDLRRCLEPHASPIEIRKLRWMEAKCVAGAGYLEPASAELWRLAGEFREMGLPYHQALVVLDLCGIWLCQGCYAEIAESARHLIQTFAELGIEREAWKAVVLLEQAASQQRATESLLAAAIRQVEGLQSGGARPAR